MSKHYLDKCRYFAFTVIFALSVPTKWVMGNQRCHKFFANLSPVQAERLGGPVIPGWFVPGWKAIFNGDVTALPDGRLLGVFRMARRNYFKIPDENKRGFTLNNYISDLGLFSSNDGGRSWTFEKILKATSYGIEDQIDYLKRVSAMQLVSSARTKVERALISLEEISEKPGLPTGVLEDPRFMQIRDARGRMRHFLFVTDVPVELLLGKTDFSSQKIYGMGALEIEIQDRSIKIIDYFRFGPGENKDTWIINFSPDYERQRQIKQVYDLLHKPLYGFMYPVLVSTRVNGSIQIIPFASLEDVFEVTPEQWEKIFSHDELYDTIASPDGEMYTSVGNNDQPFPVHIPLSHIGGFWHFYHQTGTELLQYETWVQILDGNGRPLFRLPYPLQEPVAEYELQGDIDFVIFNSGHFRRGNSIMHVNGAADSAVTLSRNNENTLAKEVMKYRVR